MLLSLSLIMPAVWGQTAADGSPTYRFNIPVQPLMQALRDFTAITGHQVVVQSDNVSEYKSAAVSGTLTAQQAMTRLLASSGLRATFSASGAVVIEEIASTLAPEPTSQGIENIVVVGSKAGATRQEFATSVGYFDAEQIRNQQIVNVEDIFARTANATTGSSISGAFSIRGVNTDGVAGSLNSSNALGSILINQVALGVASGNYLKPSVFDAASVEVLRGPQSSLQGPNALIGSVYLNYNRPNFDGYQGFALAQFGQLGTKRLGLMQNVVLAEDTLAARLVLETHQSDGAVTNTTTGRRDVQRKDEKTVRLAVRWYPMDDGDLVFDLNYQHNDSDTNPAGLVVPPKGGDLFDRKQPYNVDDAFPADFELLSLEARWNINDSWTLTSVTGASEFSLYPLFDGDISALDLLAVKSSVKEDIASQELRFAYDGDSISALIGLFYSDGDYNNTISGKGIFPDGQGGFMPFLNQSKSHKNIEQKAVFSNLIWRPLDDWEVTVGGRINREKRTVNDFSNNNGTVRDLSASASFSQFIPTLGIAHDVNDTTRIGATYSRGFQAGGISFAFFKGISVPYDEEFVNNYELFLRYQSSDGKLLLNANIFHLDWFDQQVVETLPGGVPEFDDITINAGESSISGAELEIEWKLSDVLDLFASLGYVNAEFEKFVFNKVDYAGTSFPQSPDFTAIIGGRYVSKSGFFASATYNYTDSTFSRLVSPKITRIGERHLLSARLGYQSDGWQAYIWGTNLLDHEYEHLLQDGRAFGLAGAFGSVGAPRTLGVGVQADW